MPRFRRLAAIVLVLTLTSSWALAQPRHEGGVQWEPAARAGALEAVFSRLLGWLTAVWTKEGCGLDPNGACTAGSAAPPTSPNVDAGCGLDLNGVCASGS